MTSNTLAPRFRADAAVHPFIAPFAGNLVSRPDVWTGWVRLDRDFAEYLLRTCNGGNRRMRRGRVNRYSTDNVRPGQWVETGEPLIITKSRLGASLQHRCKMVIETGIPIVVLMVIGVDDRTMEVCDGGLAKTYCDRPAPDGGSGTMQEGSAAAFKYAYDMGIMESAHRRSELSDAQKRAVIEAHPGLPIAMESVPKLRTLWGGRGIWAFLAYEFSARDKRLAEVFLRRVLEGVEVPEGSQEYILRGWLERNAERGSKRGERGRTGVHIAAIVIKAWNVIRSGGPPKKTLKFIEGEQFPVIL